MSTAMGFQYLYAADYIDREMDLWFHVIGLYNDHVLRLKPFAGTKLALRRAHRGLPCQGFRFYAAGRR